MTSPRWSSCGAGGEKNRPLRSRGTQPRLQYPRPAANGAAAAAATRQCSGAEISPAKVES
eukprot:COSAG06_NODE_4675_length_4043_cov_37.866886_2_plen_60_part_00